MPTWSVILNEAKKLGAVNPNDAVNYIVSQKSAFLRRLSEKTGRNTILYFSGFLQKQPSNDTSINDLANVIKTISQRL